MNHSMDSENPLRTLDRRDFLKLLGAAGIGVAAGASVGPPSADAAVKTKLKPTDFTFTRREQYRPFDLLAKNFVELDDGFDTDTSADYTVLTPGPERTAGTVEAGGGELRVSGQRHFTALKSNTGQVAPYATVILDVKSLVGPGPGPEDSVFVGLYKDADNYVHAFYNNRQKIIGFDVVVNGQVFGLGVTRADLTAPFSFAFVLNENEITALVNDSRNDSGFRPYIKRNVRDARRDGQSVLDMRDATTLAEYKNGFGARATEEGTIAFDAVRAGYYGEAGLRDPHVVQYADGAPYIKDNKLYFTFNNAGLGFFEKAHWAVWTLDLSDYTKLEQVGNLFFRREDGKILGHHAGQVILDETENRWIILTSSWGDFGENAVDILYAELPSTTDLLNGVQILDAIPHPVNALRPSPGKWDPGATRIDGSWFFPFVIANELFGDFQPALAKSLPGADHTELTLVGTDEDRNATEGPIIQKLGGRWRVFASNGDDTQPPELRGKYPIYNLDMKFQGYLDAAHPTNIPHPMIVPIPLPRKRKTKYILVTFNGTQYFEPLLGYGTHGDLFVMEATQKVNGFEFKPR